MPRHQHRLEISRDGSHTVYSETQGSYFHNPNGAVEESLHIYFEKPGLLDDLKNHRPVSVYETGFGTGLNLLLLADRAAALESKSEIRFTSVEAYPLGIEAVSQLNYREFLSDPGLCDVLPDVFGKLGDSDGHVVRFQAGRVQAEVHPVFFEDFAPRTHLPFSHVMHDPFDPVVSPELWTPEVFTAVRSWCRDDAVLSTFGASSRARAAMAAAGWYVARAPGALGKREMTLASPTAHKLEAFKRVDEHRLKKRYEAGEFDE